MKCSTCGQELQEGMGFCFRCGAAQEQEENENPAETITEETDAEVEKDIIEESDGADQTENDVPAEDIPSADDKTETGLPVEETEGPVEKDLEERNEEMSEKETPEDGEAVPEEERQSADGEEPAYTAPETAAPSVPTPLPMTRLRSAVEESRNAAAEELQSGRPAGRAVITFRSLREKLMDVGGSGKMLLLCILLTVQMALSALAAVAGMITAVTAMIQNGGRVNVGTTVSFPSLIVTAWLILLWILYAKCRKRSDTGYSGILITLRVFSIVNAVAASIGTAMILLGAFLYAFIPAGMLFASSLGSIPPEGFPTWLVVAIGPALFFCGAVYVLLAVYYGKAAAFFRDVNSVASEKIRPIRTGYLRFFCWLEIVTGVLGALGSAALIGSGKGLIRLLTSIADFQISPDAASRIVVAVAVVAAASAVSSLFAAVSYFVRDRLFKAASDVTKEIFETHRA